MWRVKKGECPRTNTDVIAPPPSKLFSETDNSVAILLTHGTRSARQRRRREGRVHGERPLHEGLNGHQGSETTHSLSQGFAPCSARERPQSSWRWSSG
jgi:hypothetical protein